MPKPYELKIGYDVKLVMNIQKYIPANKYGNEQVNQLLQQSQNQNTELILRQAGYGTLDLPRQVRHGGGQRGGLHQARMSTERISFFFQWVSHTDNGEFLVSDGWCEQYTSAEALAHTQHFLVCVAQGPTAGSALVSPENSHLRFL